MPYFQQNSGVTQNTKKLNQNQNNLYSQYPYGNYQNSNQIKNPNPNLNPSNNIGNLKPNIPLNANSINIRPNNIQNNIRPQSNQNVSPSQYYNAYQQK